MLLWDSINNYKPHFDIYKSINSKLSYWDLQWYLSEQFVKRANKSKCMYFNVLVDKMTDVTGIEHCVCYVDLDKNNICEDFLMFVSATDLTR